MLIHRACFVVMAPALLLSAPLAAQNQIWIQQFGDSPDDHLRASAPDGAGGVYVAGNSIGSVGGPSAGANDVWLLRYDSTGALLWGTQFGTPQSDAIAAAAAGPDEGIFLFGGTSGLLGGLSPGLPDAFVAYLDGTGAIQWILQFGTFHLDGAFAGAPDGLGGTFAAGYTNASLGGPHAGQADVWVTRIDQSGQQLWLRQFGTPGLEVASAAASDGAGGVFVAGDAWGDFPGPHNGNYDVWLARYDADGNPLWGRQFGSSAEDRVYAAALGDGGSVYLCGFTEGDLGSANLGVEDSWLARFSALGELEWLIQMGSSADDLAHGVCSDGAGGVFVTGGTYGALTGFNAGSKDIWVARYDGAGNLLGLHQSGTNELDLGLSLVPDGNGGAFASGGTRGDLGGPNAGGSFANLDPWVSRIDDGGLATRYCTPNAVNSRGLSAALNAVGSTTVSSNFLDLVASQLPTHQFALYLASLSQGSTPSPGSGQGVLCLAGAVGRFHPNVGYPLPNSGATGSMHLVVDLQAMPTPLGLTAVVAGETWNFQVWYRDHNPGPTSNFSDALSIQFE